MQHFYDESLSKVWNKLPGFREMAKCANENEQIDKEIAALEKELGQLNNGEISSLEQKEEEQIKEIKTYEMMKNELDAIAERNHEKLQHVKKMETELAIKENEAAAASNHQEEMMDYAGQGTC